MIRKVLELLQSIRESAYDKTARSSGDKDQDDSSLLFPSRAESNSRKDERAAGPVRT